MILLAALLLLLAVPGESKAAASHVASCQGVAFNVTSVGCTIASFSAGHAIAVGIYWSDTTGTLSSVTMSTCTGTVTLYNNPTVASAGSVFAATGAAFDISVGGSCTFTANFSESITELKILVHEVDGVQGGSVAGNLADADIFRNTTCTDCIPDVAGQLSITPSINGAYFFGFLGATVTAAISPGTGFTDGGADDNRGTAEYLIQTTAAPQPTTFSRTDTTGQRAIAMALVLQPAAEGTVKPKGALLGVYP